MGVQRTIIRPQKDTQTAQRDKLLFVDMGLPVSKQWLYDRHKVPAPGPKEDLYEPLKLKLDLDLKLKLDPKLKLDLKLNQAEAKEPFCPCCRAIDGKSESTTILERRPADARTSLRAARFGRQAAEVTWQVPVDPRAGPLQT